MNRLARTIIYIYICTLTTAASATDTENYFTSPATSIGDRPVWTLGYEAIIAWNTTVPVSYVTIWQQSLVNEDAGGGATIYSRAHDSDNVNNFTWTVQLYASNLSLSSVFFLWANTQAGDFVSPFFIIAEPYSAVATAATTAATTVATAGSGGAITQSTRTGFTAVERIGIGAGVGVGVPILCALGVWIWLRVRKTDRGDSFLPSLSQVDWAQQPQSFLPSETVGSGVPKHYNELPSHS
ncbi:hypothetical protein N7466_006127 [Penicillium verhagenii]|uniref:uncharacterized protein n=1 Tax=Penicillium verhagenii TaxID=1562060 RepID=UPI002545A5B2|nr:uncharacterized protein N7466_006127 [Penicillium verhagenii]KAJ5930634.1 hypothetical protein N7466_006127 [Penicillium verhagenii]